MSSMVLFVKTAIEEGLVRPGMQVVYWGSGFQHILHVDEVDGVKHQLKGTIADGVHEELTLGPGVLLVFGD